MFEEAEIAVHVTAPKPFTLSHVLDLVAQLHQAPSVTFSKAYDCITMLRRSIASPTQMSGLGRKSKVILANTREKPVRR